MDDNWDLYAVVRGCAATVTTTTNPTAAAAASYSVAANNHFPSFPPILPFLEDRNTFAFSGLVDERDNPYQGLQEVYYNYCRGYPPPTPTATAADDIPAANIMPVAPELVLQANQEFMQINPPPQLNVQIQENVQFNTSPILDSPPQNSPTTITQPIRSRRRKNQQIKTVRQMTQEELSADSWAWRKYGQKPIKGSPHPRNYYRCSTSKGCAARKQVERSSTDPEMFVVSYTGEHTHPRPTHRSSLAGSTRCKFATPFPGKGGRNNAAMLSQKGMMAFCSSPAGGHSFSPATPSMEAEAATLNGDDVQMVDEGAGDDDYENMIMPDDFMNDDDDIFRGFQDSDDQSSGGGGDFFSSGFLSSPPWTPTTSTFNGGGGH